MSTPLLKAEGLGIQFGGLKAVDEFNFEIDKNQLFGLIGPNGAGKTTVFNLLTGVYQPTSGRILFEGQPIKKAKLIIMIKKIFCLDNFILYLFLFNYYFDHTIYVLLELTKSIG